MQNEKDSTIYILDECQTPMEIAKDKTKILSESAIDSKTGARINYVTIDTVLQSFEDLNWNGRIYGKDVVLDAINNDGMIQCDLQHGTWIGEYGHPMDTNVKRQVSFDPKQASHRILNYRTEGDLLCGHVQTLAEGCGEMLYSRIMQGVPAMFSLRSLGSVDINTKRVKRPLKVVTYDSVIRPSHRKAYQIDVLTESAAEDFMQEIQNESALIFPINESISEIQEFLKDKSDNIAKVREMFNIDKLDVVLCEDTSRVDLIIEDGSRINAPVEKVLSLQYADVLKAGRSSIIRK